MDCYTQINGVNKSGQRLQPHEWPLVRTIRDQKLVADEEIRLLSPDGSQRVVSVSSRPIYDAAGALIAAVAFAVDISECQRLEKALRDAQEQLEQKVLQRTAELGRANQMLRIISECDQALIQSNDEQELIHSICRISS